YTCAASRPGRREGHDIVLDGSQELLVHFDADPGPGRDRESAVRPELEGRVHDVPVPVPVTRGSISREAEVREGSQGDVVSPADPGLEHPAAPDGDPSLGAQVVDTDGSGVAADASGLDVHDTPALERNRVGATARARYGLVEADGSAHLRLQL